MKTFLLPVLAAAALAGCAAPAPRPDLAVLKQQVIDTETAFAATMAARDHAAFVSFLAEDTVWFAGKSGVLRGKQAVADDWKRFYQGPDAPFSWKPTEVEVLDSGTLAISSGPVFGPDGKPVAVYNSIWRLEAPGQWRIIFDKGGCACGPGR
jgi:ketosteroid isomerase-like protein